MHTKIQSFEVLTPTEKGTEHIYQMLKNIIIKGNFYSLCVFHNKHTSVCNKQLKLSSPRKLRNLSESLTHSHLCILRFVLYTWILPTAWFHQLRDQVQSKHTRIHVLTGPWASSSLQLRRWAFLSTKKNLYSGFLKKKNTQ